MSNTCQFCDQDPGYLIKFAKAWSCRSCLVEYGLEDHEKTSDGMKTEQQVLYDDYVEWQQSYGEYGWCAYEQPTAHYGRLRKAKVIIEELECDPSNLAAFAKVFVTKADPVKAKVESGKWEVEIWYD